MTTRTMRSIVPILVVMIALPAPGGAFIAGKLVASVVMDQICDRMAPDQGSGGTESRKLGGRSRDVAATGASQSHHATGLNHKRIGPSYRRPRVRGCDSGP